MAVVSYKYVEYQGRYLVVALDSVESAHKVYAESTVKNNASVIKDLLNTTL